MMLEEPMDRRTDPPGSPWDYALLAAAMAASIPFIAANVVVLLHRKRRYFATQGGALLILTSSMAGLIWIVTAFVTNLHFPRNHHPFLLKCPLWSFWLQLPFGFWLWYVCQVLRLLHLHYLCQNALVCAASAHSSRRKMLFWALLLWTPGLAVAIVATVTRASIPRMDGEARANCHLEGAWKYSTYIIFPLIYFSVLAILLTYVKSNKDYMMAIEYSHTFEYSFIMAFVMFVLYGAAYITESYKKVPGRCFLTFYVCCLIFINFWVRFGWPVYLCLCKSKSDMDSFEELLRSRGAECLDNVSSAIGNSQAGRSSSSAQQYGDWLLRATDAAMKEVSEYKERINQLEQRKAILSTKIQQLEVPARMSLSLSAKG